MIRIILLLLISVSANAQRLSKADIKNLQKKQDSLSILSWRIANEISAEMRLKSDSLFTRILVRALQVKNSYYFPFDSLQVAKVSPKDSSFRIFTWQVDAKKDKPRQKGVIQYKTEDGSLRLTPLIDNSEFMDNYNEVKTSKTWVGAIYYSILQTEHQGKKYYTLLGYDENTTKSNKKWIDVLTFDENNQPLFGGDYIKHSILGLRHRLGLEYKKDARVKLAWDEEQQMIIYDHLSSDNGFVNQKETYVPDGDYEGLKWNNGMWVHQEKVMCNCPLSTKENKEQIKKPLFDANGNKIPQRPDNK
jgi:hypothetical protein